MAGPSNVLVPIVADLHFDDLLQIFRLRITFQLETPFGKFEREIVVTAATLAAIIQELITIWGTTPAATAADGLAAPLGDMAALGTWLGAATFLEVVAIVEPSPPAADSTVDATWGSYDGTVGALTGTDWGQTPVPPS